LRNNFVDPKRSEKAEFVSNDNPFEVTASKIFDEIFDSALQVLPENLLACLKNA